LKVYYLSEKCVDCTSDPHEVYYRDVDEMLDDILKVCESPLVWRINAVELLGDDGRYGSDYYSTVEWEDSKAALTLEAKKHKIYGLFFAEDFSGDPRHHLPPGLTGVKEAIKLVKKDPTKFHSLTIAVSWDFSRSHNCSDFIEADFDGKVVDYSNQDWSIGLERYDEHIQALSELLGVSIERGDLE